MLLVTGAAGGVAGMLRPGLEDFRVRAVDVRAPFWEGAENVVGDVADPAFACSVVDDVDAVVHLAANPVPTVGWEDLRRPNVEAVVSVLDAARSAGVRRVVLASSVHAAGGYYVPDGMVIDPGWPARPCCTYGATKVFAESYGFVTAARGEVSVVCLRLGACLPAPTHTGKLAGWLAPGDLRQLVRAALSADVGYGVYFGVSGNTRNAFDLGNARRELGYRPEHDAEVYADGLPEGSIGLCSASTTR